MRRQKGFMLASTLVAVGVAVTLATFGAYLAFKQNERAKLEQKIEEYSWKVQLFTRALTEYIDDNQSAWANNTSFGISAGTLMNNGYLPSGYVSSSPFGKYISAVVRKDGDGVTRAVISELGTDNYNLGIYLGLPNDSVGTTAFKRRVAASVAAAGVPAGVLPANSAIVAGHGGFTKDIGLYWPANTQPRFVSFIGFEDLSTTPGTIGTQLEIGISPYTFEDIVEGLAKGNYGFQHTYDFFLISQAGDFTNRIDMDVGPFAANAVRFTVFAEMQGANPVLKVRTECLAVNSIYQDTDPYGIVRDRYTDARCLASGTRIISADFQAQEMELGWVATVYQEYCANGLGGNYCTRSRAIKITLSELDLNGLTLESTIETANAFQQYDNINLGSIYLNTYPQANTSQNYSVGVIRSRYYWEELP